MIRKDWTTDRNETFRGRCTVENEGRFAGSTGELEIESRCHSARDRKRDREGKQGRGARSGTRSASPNFISPEFPVKKFRNICSKIVFQLDLVKNLSAKKTADAENLLDLRRQLQRADEFAIRFSRNNLYDTKRMLNEIKNGLMATDGKTLGKKIILGFQTASQSLQIYINYIKNPGNVEVPDKISELVLLIAELFLCSQNLCLPREENNIQNDAVKLCNELISILKSKIPVGEYLSLKQENLNAKKIKKSCEQEDGNKTKNLSMYKAKSGKPKPEENGKKKLAALGLVGNRPKKMRRKDEKKARMTYDIYTQKLNPRQQKGLASRAVKLDMGNRKEATDKGEMAADKKHLKKIKYFTPREVRSQDDDVETMVQTIYDDELPSLRIEDTQSEVESEKSHFNKKDFRELLFEAIEDLQNSNKKEEKATLQKLLNSIQNCVNFQQSSPREPAVKIFHFKHEDKIEHDRSILSEEKNGVKLLSQKQTENTEKPGSVKNEPNEKSAKRKLNIIFRLNQQRKYTEDTNDESNAKILLKLNKDVMERLTAYRKSFAQFTNDNFMYKKRNSKRPWDLVGKVADHIISDIIEEISMDLESEAFLNHLYLNELFEAVPF